MTFSNSFEYTKFNIQYIDKASEEIFKLKEHLFIGISPFNSYYNEKKIGQILSWVLDQKFKDFTVFLADEMSYYNLLSRQYTPAEALRSSKKKDRYLRNKTLKVFEKLNISEHKLLKFADLKESVIFKKYYDYYEEDFIKKDFTFRNILSDLIEELNLSNQEEKEEKKPDYCIDKEIAFNYFLCEMPILLNTPSLLGYSSSCIVYHQINSLHTYLYLTKHLQKLNQGFIAVNFE